MTVMNPVIARKIDRSRRMDSAIAPCLQMLEQRVMFSVPTFALSAPAFYSGTVPTGGENVTITVNRSVDTVDPVTVNYATSNGTSNANAIDASAIAGTDYSATSGTLSFPANHTSESFTVHINQPNTGVGDKVFTITLSSPSNSGSISTGAAAVLINQSPRAFQAGDAVVEVGGNGATPLSATNGANTVYINEYSPTGTLLQSFPLPNAQTGSQTIGANRPLTAGDSGFEGLIGNSLDGQNLLLGGYNGSAYDFVVGTTNETSEDTVGIVDANGNIDTETGVNAASSFNLGAPPVRGIRTADDSTVYYTSSSGGDGLQQVTRDTVITTTQAYNVNLGTPRALSMDANGDLFGDSTTTNPATGYLFGIPTDGSAVVGLPGFNSANAGGPTQFAFASNVTEDDTIYLQNGNGPSNIEKFSLVGATLAQEVAAINAHTTVPGTWVLESSTLLPNNAEGLGLTVDQISPTQVQIFDTLAPFSISGTSGTTSSLYSLTDTLNLTSPTPVSGKISTIATLPGNTASGGGSTVSTQEFHCVANAPVTAGVTETTFPQSQAASLGQTVTFTAWAGQQNLPSTALGTSVQWYEIAPGSSTPTALYGQTFTTLNVTATDALNGAQFYAVFSNSNTGASDGSEHIATLTVNDNPYVTNVAPTAVNPAGGSVTLTGGNFTAGSTVSLQGIAGSITPTSIAPNGNSLTFTAPAEAAGTYDVQVTNSSGTSTALSSETLTFATQPVVTSISPSTGPDGGGTSVTINGTGFVNGATVKFGTVAATSVTFVSPTQLIAVTPTAATAAGTVDTLVSENIGGSTVSSTASSVDQFIYFKETVAQVEEGADDAKVLLDNNPIVTAITQHIGTFDGDTYSTEEFLLDDGTASIMAVATSAQLGGYIPTVGDELNIAGQFSLDTFPLLPQLVNITSITKVASGQMLPANFDPTINVATASTNPVPTSTLAAQVVTITGATINELDATGDTFGANNLTYNISDSSDPYIPANGSTPASGGLEFYYAPSQIGISVENLAGLPVPSTNVTVTGIIQNYYGVNEFCPISIPGNSERFSFTTSNTSSDKNANAVTDGFSSVNRGSTITITVNRLESVPMGGTADTGTVNVLLTADTGVAGTDFSVAGHSPSNGTITVPVTFAPGATSTTITVTTGASAGEQGSKLFTISLANPATNNAGSPTNPLGFDVSTTTNPLTVAIEDTSVNEYDEFASVASGALQSEMANVEAAQVTGSDALNVESNSQGQNADYAIMTFDDSGFDPTDILNNGNTVETINGLQFEALPVKEALATAGALNVYIITDTSHVLGTGTTYPTTGLSFNPSYTTGIAGTVDPTTGIISGAAGLGTLYPLGSIAFDPTKVVYGSENAFNLSTLNPIGTQLLASDITQGTPITIVIAPGDGNVAASFAGFVNTNQVQQTAPNLRIQYNTTLPTWVTAANSDANSQTVLITPTNTLAVTGGATITANPTSPDASPSVAVFGSTANLNVSSSSPTGVSLGSLSLSTGANAEIASLATPQVVFIAAGTSALSIDSTSTLDLGQNIIDLHNGSTAPTNPSLLSQVTTYIATGYNNGTWNNVGGSIESTAAAADSSHLSAIGVALGSQFGGTTLDGQAPGAFDVLVRETYYGDANLDGKVDGSDYSRIDNGYLSHLNGWANGDFNYDGAIDGSDYTLTDNAFNRQSSPFGTPTAQLAARLSGAVSKSKSANTARSAGTTLAPAASTTFQSNTASASIDDLLKQDSSNILLAKDVLDNLHAG